MWAVPTDIIYVKDFEDISVCLYCESADLEWNGKSIKIKIKSVSIFCNKFQDKVQLK
jgi:hypothetical protein